VTPLVESAYAWHSAAVKHGIQSGGGAGGVLGEAGAGEPQRHTLLIRLEAGGTLYRGQLVGSQDATQVAGISLCKFSLSLPSSSRKLAVVVTYQHEAVSVSAADM
jgi:hypothetical protein